MIQLHAEGRMTGDHLCARGHKIWCSWRKYMVDIEIGIT